MDSFSKAKKILQRQIDMDHRTTIYCEATFDDHKKERLGKRQPAIVLKIETRRGFANLPAMLPRCGVMIARGDLAVECGFERMAEVQEEILWICEAAHVPVIWATQVLESLAKDGMPSRAEISDASMGHRAECVMLNKGPHVVTAVQMLDGILRRMQAHQFKKRTMIKECNCIGISGITSANINLPLKQQTVIRPRHVRAKQQTQNPFSLYWKFLP